MDLNCLCYNLQEWPLEIPHATQCSSFAKRFTINVQAGIVDSYFTGPYMIVNHPGGTHYADFPQRTHLPLMEDVPLNVWGGLWFHHDSAHPCFSHQGHNWLKNHFLDTFFSCGGQIVWHACSPDLNQFHFFLWGCIKVNIYATEVQDLRVCVDGILIQLQSFRTLAIVLFLI
jgi:hypothetical protein